MMMAFLAAVICAFCAGLCVGVVLTTVTPEDSREDAKAPPAKGREMTEDEAKEFRKRQQEIQNFFSYTGDVIPEKEG